MLYFFWSDVLQGLRKFSTQGVDFLIFNPLNPAPDFIGMCHLSGGLMNQLRKSYICGLFTRPLSWDSGPVDRLDSVQPPYE